MASIGCSWRNLALNKRRPSPGGEEARVVVYQPRGVGLMHTRHKPSNTHYTHDPAHWRKSLSTTRQPGFTAELQ